MVASGSSVDTLSVRPRSDSSPLVRSNSSFNPNPLRCFVQTCCKLFQCRLTIVVAAGRVNSSVRPHSMTHDVQLIVKVIAGTTLVIALVIGFFERWYKPDYYFTAQSKELPGWVEIGRAHV